MKVACSLATLPPLNRIFSCSACLLACVWIRSSKAVVNPGVGSLLCLVGLDNATHRDICWGLEPASVLETVFVKTPSFLLDFSSSKLQLFFTVIWSWEIDVSETVKPTQIAQCQFWVFQLKLMSVIRNVFDTDCKPIWFFISKGSDYRL